MLVMGQVHDVRGGRLPGIDVQLHVRTRRVTERPLGRPARTDGEGRYAVEFDAAEIGPDLDRGARLFVRVSGGDGVSGTSELHPVAGEETVIDVRVDTGPGRGRRVFGVVRDEFGGLLDDVTVLAVDRDLRNEEQLGRSPTRAGRYDITYHPDQFRRAEKSSADLVLIVIGRDGEQLFRTAVQFNVPDELEVDITLDGRIYGGASEWEVRTDLLEPLLDGVAPQDVREDAEFQDVSFLAGETGYDPLAIATWAASFRLADKSAREQTPLPPEVFFAYLAQGQPSVFQDSLREDVQHADRLVLIDDKLLRGLAELTAVLQQSLLDKAVADNLVPRRVGPTIPDVVATLGRIRARYAGERTFGGGKGTIGELLALTPDVGHRQPEFLTLLGEHTGPLDDFWHQVVEHEVLPEATAAQVKVTFGLGALTRNHMPLVAALGARLRDGATSPRTFATFSRDEWKAVLGEQREGAVIGAPSNFDGDTEDERLDHYAAVLDWQFERAYPTTSFTAKLGRAGRAIPRVTTEVTRFLEANPAFQLDRYRVDHYLGEHSEALVDVGDAQRFTADLKTVQRVFKLLPTYSAVETLLDSGIESAQQIYYMGPAQFLSAVAETPINKVEARRLYRKAENSYALALALYGDHNQAINGMSPFAVPSFAFDAQLQAKIAALPNLQTLFGTLDYCECAPCRSVYSPAAHLVDIMRFLGQRGTQGTAQHAGKSVRQVLLERRPDLGEIELSCENTNTPVPYIDLVNEILEDVVAPPAPVELAVAIEPALVAGPIAATVVAELTAKNVPIAADAVVYGADSRGRWVVRDQQRAYTIARAGAVLRLLPSRQTFLSAAEARANPEHSNPEAYTALGREIFPLTLPFDLWHCESRTYLEHLGLPQPRLFELFQKRASDGTASPSDLEIDAAWLGVTESARLAATDTVPGKAVWDLWGLAENGNVVPHPDLPADPSRNLTGTWIEVLATVPVLLNRTGSTYPELLQLLDTRYVDPAGSVTVRDGADSNAANCDTATFTVANLTAGVLTRLNRFLRLRRILGCTVWELDVLLPEIADVMGRIPERDFRALSHLSRLRVRTGLDWITLHACYAGIDHIVHHDRSTGAPVQTLYQRLFRNRLVDAVAAFPPTPAELGGPISARVPGILAALQVKESDLRMILADLGLTAADQLDASTLGRIYRVTTLARALSMPVEEFLAVARLSGQDPFADAAATLAFVRIVDRVNASGFSVAELDYLLAHRTSANSGIAPADSAVVGLLRALREGLQRIDDEIRVAAEQPAGADPVDEAYLAALLADQRASFVREKVAETLELAVPTATALLEALTPPGDTGPIRTVFDDPRLLARRADGDYEFELNETTFPAAFTATLRLHKIALLVGKLELTVADVIWWLDTDHAAGLGWMHPGALPTDATSPVPLSSWLALERFVGWRADLPPSGSTALEFATELVDGSASTPTVLATFAALAGWQGADLDAMVQGLRWFVPADGVDVVRARLRDPDVLVRLADCRRTLARLGVGAARALAWADARPTVEVAEGLKQTVKAKYDLAQWRKLVEPIQDRFRDRKRAALVGWLVAHPVQAEGQHWSDSNGLYSHYLIDVEMSACMLTSRLKQAAASAQLFVQRCLLNLEGDILANTVLDPKWKQWKWMKNYRVWEANRKVFLYPENWIEPELRDEKSPFFVELEAELMQSEITQESVEQAYLGYLEKLDRVANLEIRAMLNEPLSQDESALHVIGRSRSSQSPEHFYRKRVNGARWTAWEKIDLEIATDHLAAGVHNRRLYLLWPQFIEKAVAPVSVATPRAESTSTVPPPTKHWEVRLFWSELKRGKWTPEVLSDAFLAVAHSHVGGEAPQRLGFRTRTEPEIHLRLFGINDPVTYAPISNRGFVKAGTQITTTVETPIFEQLVAPPESHFHHNLIRHDTASQYFYYNSVEERGPKPHLLGAHENAPAIRLLRNIAPGLTYTVLDAQARGFSENSAFFVWDHRRSYFVDYTWRTDMSYFSRAWHATITSSFRYHPHYHPFVELFVKELNIWGLRGLLNRRIQLDPAGVPGHPPIFDFAGYGPEGSVPQPWPVEDVDFSYRGAYASYNWELFFHVPFFIANRLSANQRFAEALEWFHYIFDPTSTDTSTADPDTPQQKFWITKPFYETTRADYYKQKIENIMLGIAKGDAELREQVREWRDNPFNPHLVARMRTAAYQKNVLVKYLGTLIAWGDQLFAHDTIESINEATQLYVLAASVLGPRPRIVPRDVPQPVKTYYQLQADGIDDFGNVLVDVENLLPGVSAAGSAGDDTPELPHLDVLYFGIPHNDKLVGLWDTVDDRLFKIRHCMNLAGVVRDLPLFEPPIDPALLVRATAAGLDIGAVLSDLNAPLPAYRFSSMLERAHAVCADVTALGAAMLSALEKRDAEALTLLRAGHEQKVLDQVRQVRVQQIDEALRTKESLEEAKKVVEARKAHYERLIDAGWNGWEHAWLGLTIGAIGLETASTVVRAIGASLAVIPSLDAGAAGFGASPTVKFKIGGQNFALSLYGLADVLKGAAGVAQMGAGMTSAIAGYERRAEEWELQRTLTERELPQLDKQIAAAEIRHQMAIKELAGQDVQIENAKKEDEYLRTKFTNRELYEWMVNQISTVHFQSYQLAVDLAKRAERAFRYELGLVDSGYVQAGYWDSLRKGLLAGERLSYDLRRLHAAYVEQNRREYELTKRVSLAQLDPVALLGLRQNGECLVDVPETLFDMDHPGHYFRRIKSVSLSVPCVVGPYTSVACRLTLTANQLRQDATLLGGTRYARDTTIADPRFRDQVGAVQSIATSEGLNDDGLFQLDFRDERYLPFEGAGAISSWRIAINKTTAQFDLATISDVILQIGYTAREGGDALADRAVEEFDEKLNDMALAEGRRGLYRVFDLRREFPDKWHRFLRPTDPGADQELVLDDLAERLPFVVRRFGTRKVRRIEVLARLGDGASYEVSLAPPGGNPADLLTLAPDPAFEGLHRAARDLTGAEVPLGPWTVKIRTQGAADFRSLPVEAVSELFLVVNYTVS